MANEALQKEVAKRQKAEQALHHSERFLVNVFDSIQDPSLTILDTDFNIIRVNPTAERWFPSAVPKWGKNALPSTTAGKNPAKFVPPGKRWKPAKQLIK